MKKGRRRVFRFILVCMIFFVAAGYLLHKPILKRYFPIDYEPYVYRYSTEYELEPMMVFSVIRIESNYQESAMSNKNAMGLMQIMPDTGVWIAEQMGIENFEVEDLNDPETNIKLGCWYLNNLKEEFNGNMQLVLAAYNAGRGNVNKWLGDAEYSDDGEYLKRIPFAETDKYIIKIEIAYRLYKYLYI